MAWNDDDKHPFAGISKKLDRADENIVNLHKEIVSFFEASKYPVLPHPNDKLWQEALDYHKALPIPLRFSVLTGEIVHHLRSCLDHIVWHFSSPAARKAHENTIEFPVYRKPLTPKQVPRFDGKIQGITNTRVRKLIYDLQPFHDPANAATDPLTIVHDMDRFDKHRELVICSACGNAVFPPDTDERIIQLVTAYSQGKSLSPADLRIAQRAVKNDAKMFPQVEFAYLGQNSGFVVVVLMDLFNAIRDVVIAFAAEV